MALDKLTLLDETVINNSATSAATIVVNNSVQTNYISFAVATASPTSNGWRTYNDGAATSPVDGVSGTVDSTLTQNTVLPLNSTGDFRLTKNSGASRQGEGFSTDFTIANRHLGKVLQVSFDYELVSGTLATDDIRLYVIQSPSSSPTVIEPVGVSLQGTVSGTRLRHIATFQTHISITSYRLCIHIATTTNSLQVIDFNNFRVWESTQSVAAVITDWQSYSATINGISVSSSSYRWRRSGGSVEISGSFTFSSQSGLEFQIPLPSGLSISSIVDRKTILGKLHLAKASFDSSNPQWFLVGITGTSYLTLAVQSNNANNLLTNYSSASTGASSGDIFTFFASVPIAGWGSSVAMSSDSGDGRVVAVQSRNLTTNGTTGALVYNTIIRDTHNAYNTTTGVFTAPVNGDYRFSLTYNTSQGDTPQIFINGSPNGLALASSEGSSYYRSTSYTHYLLAGQTIDFRRQSGATTYSNSGVSMSIERISAGSQIMAQTETVGFRAQKDGGSTSPNNYITSWSNAKLVDTHNLFDIIQGEYTVPLSGLYVIGFLLGINNYINNLTSINAEVRLNGNLINGSVYGRFWNGSNSTYDPGFLGHTFIIKMNQGDKIRLYYTGYNYTIGHKSGSQGTYFEAYRIGI